MRRYRIVPFIAYAGDHDEHATYDGAPDDYGDWVLYEEAQAEIDRLRSLLHGWHDAWRSGHGQDCTSGCYDMDRETIRTIGNHKPNDKAQQAGEAGSAVAEELSADERLEEGSN